MEASGPPSVRCQPVLATANTGDDDISIDPEAQPRPQSQHTVSESEARQIRKLAAAMRKPPERDAVDVNAHDDAALLHLLAQIRKLPTSVAKRIVALRPFVSRTDLVQRVNAASSSKQDRLGPAFIPKLCVPGAATILSHCHSLS